jgi:O-antigen ligase
MNDWALGGRRERIWPAAEQMMRQRPLTGYGFNTYMAVYAEQRGIEKPDYSATTDSNERERLQGEYLKDIDDNVHPHNELLQAWTSMGIAGVFFYGAAFASVLLTYLKMRRRKVVVFPAAVGLGVFAWYMGHTAQGVFDCFFFFRHAFCAAAVMLAFMFGLFYLNRYEKPDDSGSSVNEQQSGEEATTR